MKQTIAELGIGGEGWIVYNDFILPKRVVHVYIVNNLDKDCEYLMPRYLLREYIESNGVNMTKDLVAFGNEIVYSTKEEAEAELHEQVSKTITSIEQKSVDWKKIKNIADPQSNDINWKQVRINAAISILNSLLETTQHSVTEEIVINDIYARTAIAYADTLIKELKKTEDDFEKLLEL